MSETIIQKLKLTTNNNEFYVKRDDLLPFCFGGNKARIAKTFLEDFMEIYVPICLGLFHVCVLRIIFLVLSYLQMIIHCAINHQIWILLV